MEKLNKGHWSEALHISWMIQDMVERYLINHVILSRNPDLEKIAEEAQDKLNDLYQAIANKMS
jgi:hypothetical protein